MPRLSGAQMIADFLVKAGVRHVAGIPGHGIWTVLDLVVNNEAQKTRTELTTTSIYYNAGLTDDDLSRRQLEQAVR